MAVRATSPKRDDRRGTGFSVVLALLLALLAGAACAGRGWAPVTQPPAAVCAWPACFSLTDNQGGKLPFRALPPAEAVLLLSEAIGLAPAQIAHPEGCAVGFLGSLSLVRFESRDVVPGRERGAVSSQALAVCQPVLVALGAQSWPVLMAFHQDDGQGNVTNQCLVRDPGTNRYWFVLEYAG
jgi:hypothetical protein